MNNSSFFPRLADTDFIASLLRFSGVSAVLASMSLFLLNGWVEGNDINRYLKLLAQTGLLTAAGIVLSSSFKDFKGARIFFALSLVSVTANFTILSALIYSIVQWDNALQYYPKALTWHGVTWVNMLPVLLGSVACLGVLSRFALRIFARQQSRVLWLTFLSLCLSLLIPIRNSVGISIIVGITCVVAYYVCSKVRQRDDFIATNEAKFALAILFIAPLIMLARALSLYNVDQVMAITFSGLFLGALRAVSLYQAGQCVERQSILLNVNCVLQFILAGFIAFQFAALASPSAGVWVKVAVFSSVMLALTLEFVVSGRPRKARRTYLLYAVLGVSGLNILSAFLCGDLALKMLTLLVSLIGVVMLRFSPLVLASSRAIKVLILIVAASAMSLLFELFSALELNNWIVLGMIGAGLIIAGSLQERLGASACRYGEPSAS